LFAALLAGGFLALPVAAGEPTPEGVEFFEKNVRPLLTANCHPCHSAATKHRGNLLLDSRAGLLKGGDTGPALVPGEPDRSLLVKAIGYKDADLRMPPRSNLTNEQIATLTTWVRMGAPWPETAAASGPTGKETFDLKERSKHWSLQPLRAHALPSVQHKDWP